MDINQTLEERGSRYGEFDEHARITQNIKKAMVDSPNWETLSDSMKESLEMVAHKVGRILNGDPYYHDSWHDIIGYTKLVADEILKIETERRVYESEIEALRKSAPIEDGWIEWKGGERPVMPEVEVEVMLRIGSKNIGKAIGFYWDHVESFCDIVAYRVAKNKQPGDEVYTW